MMTLELRAKLRLKDYGEPLWLIFCAGIGGYFLLPYLPHPTNLNTATITATITRLIKYQPILTGWTALFLLLGVLTLQTRRKYHLRLVDGTLQQWGGAIIQMLKKQVTLRNLKQIRIENVTRQIGKYARDFDAFILVPKPSSDQENITIPFPIGRDEQNSQEFIEALRSFLESEAEPEETTEYVTEDSD